MRFYKRNERKYKVCKKCFQSNIALPQLLFFVKTTYFHGSIASGFDCIESFPKHIFDSAKDLSHFVHEIKNPKTGNPFENQRFEHVFFWHNMKFRVLSKINQIKTCGLDTPPWHPKRIFRCVRIFVFCVHLQSTEAFQNKFLHFQKTVWGVTPPCQKYAPIAIFLPNDR